jgi:hypothetical protein
MLKWIFSQLDDTVLFDLANKTNVKVRGFRNITLSNLRIVKPQVVNEMQNPKKAIRLKSGLQQYLHKKFNEEEIKSLRSSNEQELKAAIANNKYVVVDVCIALITGEAEEQRHELAEQLYLSWSQKESGDAQVEKPEHQEAKEEQWAAKEAEYIQKLRELEEKVTKEKETNQYLQDMIDELRMKRKSESKEWRKERAEYANQLKQLTSEIQQIKTEYEQLIEKNKKVTEERNKLTQQIKEITKKLEISKLVHSHFLIEPAPKPQQPLVRTKKVILLGESIPSSIMNRAKFDIELVTNSLIEDFLQQGQTADEIWMLTFQISPQKQRKVRNAIGHEQLIQFSTILELQSYINTK